MSTRTPDAGATQPNAPQSVAQAAPLGLTFVYPRELAGRELELKHGLSFGRDPNPGPNVVGVTSGAAHVCVPHPTVSRRQALIQSGFGAPVLLDLGSSNGTRLDGAKVTEPTALAPQQVVRFGDTLAVVDERPTPEPALDEVSLRGAAASMVRLRGVLARAARQSPPVLILGETGTGKEWLAADVHRLSGRRGPYLKLSCAELSPQLIESQLFGHERGAFTGADARHTGLFEAAHEGSIFLDEIGELPLESQAKLLRVLQEGEVRPVGSVKTRRVDVRVVCATNRDLSREVEAGTFRRDLLARLSVFELRLPPLRRRRQDILEWTTYFCRRAGRDPHTIHWQPAVAERLLLHSWPDNLRGLERLTQRLLSLGHEVTVGMQLLREVMPELSEESAGSAPPAALPTHNSSTPPRDGAVDAARAPLSPTPAQPTREEFLAVYEELGRNIRAISKRFGRDRRQIYRWLEAFGIER